MKTTTKKELFQKVTEQQKVQGLLDKLEKRTLQITNMKPTIIFKI